MNGESDNKQEGASYPYCSLVLCLPVAEAVKTLGGRKDAISKSLVASALKEDERSQTLLFKINAAKIFGIIESRGRQFQLSEAGKRYFFPTSDNDRRSALLEFLQKPRAFDFIIRRFDGGKLPETQHLGNILYSEADVPESWKTRVASFFVKSAELVGIIDSENNLRFKAAKEGQFAKDSTVVENGSVNQDETKPDTSQPERIETGGQLAPIAKQKRLSGNLNVNSDTFMVTRSDEEGQQKTIYAEVPKEMNLPLWNLLNSWVQSLKPVTGKK